MACSTVTHEKALHNYFISCLNLQKAYGNIRKSSEISANFRKLRKRFKPVFEELKRFMKLLENFENSSKVFFRCVNLWFFKIFGKSSEIFGNVRKSSEVFGNLRKFSENLRKRFKSNFQMFFWFLKIFGKTSEIFGNRRKCSEIFGKFPYLIGNTGNGSQELKSFEDGFWEVLKWTPVNCCAPVVAG